MSFSQWMKELGELIGIRFAIDLGDLPDMSYSDWYEAGLSLEEGLEEVSHCMNEYGYPIDFSEEAPRSKLAGIKA